MILRRIVIIAMFLAGFAALMVQWNQINGFDALDLRWWRWMFDVITKTGGIPNEFLYPVWWTILGTVLLMAIVSFLFLRPGSQTLHGDTKSQSIHGSARWAKWADVRKAGLSKGKGLVVGGWKGICKVKYLQHDGPEHLLCFGPTRTGKGVSLIIPTLLTWLHSVFVLDLKGENFALTAGWRALIGQKIIKFDPTSATGSARYNPLAEIRIGTDHEIADCQSIAHMIIDADGKGLKDFWKEGGWEWLTATILHVLYRTQRYDGRTASLADVRTFLSGSADSDNEGELSKDETGFDQMLNDMAQFDHGRESVDSEVRQAATDMFNSPSSQRMGLHSSAKVKLALYADPIIAANTSESDFRIDDLMNGDQPASFYFIIPPLQVKRLSPLIRIMINQFLSRQTDEMNFENGVVKPDYKYRLAYILDEFPAIGKLEIFEKGLGFIAGYGLKAFIFVQDLAMLQHPDAYGRDESITSNCGIHVAFTPNKMGTAEYLTKKTGKTTVVQKKRSKSHSKSGVSISESISEVGRQLMTPDECTTMPKIRKNIFGRTVPGDMLIFAAGSPAIYGKQRLFFQDPVMKKRAAIPAPAMKSRSTFSTPPHSKNDDQKDDDPYGSALKKVDGED